MSSGAAVPLTAATSAALDTAKLLLQKVVRAFYGPRGAILVDQLIQKDILKGLVRRYSSAIHNHRFPADELARRLGMQIKDVTKIAHRLLEDQIVHVHRRSEMRDNGFAKAQQRSYYYLDYSKATDVVKWRMWRIQQTIDVKLRNELDAQGYTCPLCKATYTPLDAASLFDPSRNLLACSICQTEVVNKENEEDIRGNKDRMQRLNRQTKGIVDLLKKMERVELPKFDAEAYLLIHGPALGATAAAAAEANGNGPAAAAVVKIHMAGDDDEANEKERRERELQEKRAQNALPSWIAQSTISADPEQRAVGGEAGAGAVESRPEARSEAPANGQMSSSAAAGGATLRMDDETKPSVHDRADEVEPGEDASLDAYYASLAALEEGTPGVDSMSSLGGTPAVSAGAVDSPALSLSATPARADSEQVDPVALADLSADVSAASSAKRSREASAGDEVGEANKRARTAATGSPSEERADPTAGNVGERSPAAPVDDSAALDAQPGEENADDNDDEDEFDEFEPAVEGDADPNQPVMVAGKEMPFSEVTDDMTGEMTADEYSAYWDVYQRVNA